MFLTQAWFSLEGRVSRRAYWFRGLTSGLVLGAMVVLGIAMGGLHLATAVLVGLIVLPLLWIGWSLAIRRLHDRNKCGWWLVLFWLAPGLLNAMPWHGSGLILNLAGWLLGSWGGIELGMRRGTPGPNQYGLEPVTDF